MLSHATSAFWYKTGVKKQTNITCVYTSNLTLEGKLVGKAHVNALVGSYLQDLEPLPTSRYLQDELVGNDCHL